MDLLEIIQYYFLVFDVCNLNNRLLYVKHGRIWEKNFTQKQLYNVNTVLLKKSKFCKEMQDFFIFFFDVVAITIKQILPYKMFRCHLYLFSNWRRKFLHNLQIYYELTIDQLPVGLIARFVEQPVSS